MLAQISSSVYVETGHLGSNNGIVVGDDGAVVLIDAPHKPTDAEQWATRVAEFGTVTYLVHTDHHPDHVIGNAWLPGTVVAHEGTRRRLMREPLSREYLSDLYAVIDPAAVDDERSFSPRLPEITFNDRLTLHCGQLTVELHHVPGHTVNTIVALVPEEGVIFTGDNVCSAGLPSFQDSSVARWFDALDRIKRLDFDVLVGGHGEPAGREAVDRYREEGRAVIREVAEGMERGRSRNDLVNHVRFPDRLHVGSDSYAGYPDHLIELFQRRSIDRIYEDLSMDGALANQMTAAAT